MTAIDAERAVVTIGPEEDLFADTVAFDEASWTSGSPPPVGAAVQAKARYRAEPAEATFIEAGEGTGVLRFANRQRALTPGQAIAIYRGDEVLGGGTIQRAWRS